MTPNTNPKGQMLTEVDQCRELFDALLTKLLRMFVKTLRSAAGISDEILEREYQTILANL